MARAEATFLVCCALASALCPAIAAGETRPCPAEDTPAHRELVGETCAAVEVWLAEVPGVGVTRSQGLFSDERLGCTRVGCEVKATGRFSALRGGPGPVDLLAERLRGSDWRDTRVHSADGPDGTRFSLHKPGALCIVVGSWNHWDDEDGPHLADPFEVTVSCGVSTTRPPTLEDGTR